MQPYTDDPYINLVLEILLRARKDGHNELWAEFQEEYKNSPIPSLLDMACFVGGFLSREDR